MNTQGKILKKYKSIRGDFLDVEDNARQIFFENLLDYRYLTLVGDYKDKKVIEIGCNKGFLLKALQNKGFSNLSGIDLCQEDLELARKRTSLKTLENEDLFNILAKNRYDLIISKDVMEHIAKERQEEFVELIFKSLNDGGMALIQVPNMDWLMSNHERYMDFTHEVGYTRESLADLFRIYFRKVSVLPVSYIFLNSKKNKFLGAVVRPILLKAFRLFLKILGEGAHEVWFEHREIMAVVKK